MLTFNGGVEALAGAQCCIIGQTLYPHSASLDLDKRSCGCSISNYSMGIYWIRNGFSHFMSNKHNSVIKNTVIQVAIFSAFEITDLQDYSLNCAAKCSLFQLNAFIVIFLFIPDHWFFLTITQTLFVKLKH